VNYNVIHYGVKGKEFPMRLSSKKALEDFFDEYALEQARLSKLPAMSSTFTVRGWGGSGEIRFVPELF
jgi:hypothetical protein